MFTPIHLKAVTIWNHLLCSTSLRRHSFTFVVVAFIVVAFIVVIV